MTFLNNHVNQMPDYDAKVELSDNSYIAPKNGIVRLLCSGSPVGGMSIYVNGQSIAYFATPTYPMDCGLWVLVKGGDVVTFNPQGSVVYRTFFPMRAA